MKQPMTILVADDDESMRKMFEKYLDVSGHKVHIAKSGEEALMKIGSLGNELDLVITDLQMGGAVDGLDVVRICIEKKIAVILMSGNAHEEIKLLAREIGATFVEKTRVVKHLKEIMVINLSPAAFQTRPDRVD